MNFGQNCPFLKTLILIIDISGELMMIETYAFGHIVINGIRYTSDIKIVQGKVLSNWWRKSGHKIVVEDILDILDSEPDILVFGRGEPGLMKSSQSLREFLNSKNIELIEVKTTEAVQTFNRLFKEGRNVSAGFHLSC
jgi:hypothetical protein